MKMVKVESSAVKALGFADGVLKVQYTSGGTYSYKGETAAEFKKLRGAKSIGKSLAAHLGIHTK